MITNKGISLIRVIQASIHHIIWLLALMTVVTLAYEFKLIEFKLPWLPVSVIGTAVAFFVGFKNNQAYDRLWEARKIWGGIVNESRTWGMMVDGFLTNLFTEKKVSEQEILSIKKKLIYRHIAWLYAHRSQLLIPTSWEQVSQSGFNGNRAKTIYKKFGVGMLDDEITKIELKNYLPENEYDRLVSYANTATQIINQQSRDLTNLRAKGLIEDFRHMEMEGILRSFYTLQGKNERIKKFPLPRQYANLSRHFVFIFIWLLPFTMIPELLNFSEVWYKWLTIPITALIGWVYMMMEEVGDYTENPFQGLPNDIPMLSLCRVIEIDLKQMLEETNLPPAIEPKNGFLF